MTPNPFVELLRNPVATLTAFAYLLALLSASTLLVGLAWNLSVTVATRYREQRPTVWTYVPPTGFLLRLAAVPLLLAIVAAMIGAAVWILSGGAAPEATIAPAEHVTTQTEMRLHTRT